MKKFLLWLGSAGAACGQAANPAATLVPSASSPAPAAAPAARTAPAAESLWTSAGRSLFTDPAPPAFGLHDHILIEINQSDQAQSNVDLTTDRRSRWEAKFDAWPRIDPFKAPFLRESEIGNGQTPEIDLDWRYRLDDKGRTNRNATFRSHITAEVVNILPNGNLVVEARTSRVINDETEDVSMSGIVSPSNVSTTPTGARRVNADLVANLQLRFTGRGSVGDNVKQGWLTRIFGWLWPF